MPALYEQMAGPDDRIQGEMVPLGADVTETTELLEAGPVQSPS